MVAVFSVQDGEYNYRDSLQASEVNWPFADGVYIMPY